MRDPRQIPPLTPRRRGYQDYLAGLGDPCPFPINTVQAIEWRDGWVIAERILRELEEEAPVLGL
jgi:ribosome modulation factor